MQLQGSPSWRISSRVDVALGTALYVRDAAGLERLVLPGPDLPLLHPPAARREDVQVDLRLAVREWEQWWHRAVGMPEGSTLLPRPGAWNGLEDLLTMRQLLTHCYDDVRAWLGPVQERAAARAQARTSLDLTRLVNGYGARLDRPIRPFRLRITELPFGRPTGWVLTPHSLLVSSELYDDPAALAAFLLPIVEARA